MKVLQISGGTPLRGTISAPGSKNAGLAILSAVLLADGESVLHNVPNVSDIRIKSQLLETFGAKVRMIEGSLFIDSSDICFSEPEEDQVRLIRTSFYLLGPLLARLGRVRIPAPGGCKIGARPVDYHLKSLEAMGATIRLENGWYFAETNGLKAANLYFDFPSAGATQHMMATACLADGITTIDNAAIEPEVTALAGFLNSIGANIEGAGTGTITITGRKSLQGSVYRIPDDRLQAGTYLLAGAITGGDVTVTDILPENQTALINKLIESGVEVEEGPNWVRAKSNGRMKGIRVKTMPHPGFPTDMQQPMAAALTLASGISAIEETIYESRIGHIPELRRMGANIELQGRTALITGVKKLDSAIVEASDLRAGAALVLAGLAAEGETTVRNIHFIDRGYEDIEGTLQKLGASVTRIEEESAGPKEVLS